MSEPITTPEPVAPEGQEPPAQAPSEPDWKAEARKWEQRAKDNAAKLKEAAPKITEYERMVDASKTEQQRQAEELTRWQTDAERWRTAAVGSRIEALASVGGFADPTDAASALADKLAGYLDAGGQINEAAIKADLEEVLTRKPHWRKQDGSPAAPRVPAPNPAQGSGGGRPVADPAQEFAAILQGQLRS